VNLHADTGDARGVSDGQVIQRFYCHLGRDTDFPSSFPVAIDCFFTVVSGLFSHLFAISLTIDTALVEEFHDRQQADRRLPGYG
jgi:hypothetical protein